MNCDRCAQSCHSRSSKSTPNWLNFFKGKRVKARSVTQRTSQIALVGSPNVGKSLIFNILTGNYATVSNYPGTTVEVTRGKTNIGKKAVTVIDTPGMFSLLPISEEESVARNLLFSQHVDLVIHVVDAKNLGRMLALTFQLIETKLPVMLAVNMIDEAEELGIHVDGAQLEATLGIPVVTMTAAQRIGIGDLKARVAAYV